MMIRSYLGIQMPRSDRWVNRRSMAWAALIAGLGFPLLILSSESQTLADIAIPFYTFVSAVVGSYIGFATLDDKWTRDET